jgi:hypothetical protein
MESRYLWRISRQIRQVALFSCLFFVCLHHCSAQDTRGQQPRTVPICELFGDLRAHNDEVVAVRGQLNYGREVFNVGAICERGFSTQYSTIPKPGANPEVAEYRWPTALALATPTSRESVERPVPFAADEGAIARVYEFIASETKRLGGNVIVEVTVVGQLRLKDDYHIHRTDDGMTYGIGYGHLSAAPGELVFKTMVDPVVKKVDAK